MAEKPGARELAQVASSEHRAVVDAQLMDLTLRGADRSGFPSDDVAGADAALARIAQAIDETGELINAHIAARLSLPLEPVPLVLTRVARAVVRYELHKDRITDARTDPIARDYYDALRLLESIRDGKVTVGTEDPTSAAAPTQDIRIAFGRKAFGDRELQGFR